MTPAKDAANVLKLLGVDGSAGELVSHSPIDGQPIGRVAIAVPGAA